MRIDVLRHMCADVLLSCFDDYTMGTTHGLYRHRASLLTAFA